MHGMTEVQLEAPLAERVMGDILHVAAREVGGQVFVEFDDRTFTYEQLDESTDEVARGLVAQGVEAGDRIVALLPNRHEFIQLWFAAAKIGATIVPINPEWRGETLEYILTDAEPKFIVVTPESLLSVQPILDRLGDLIGIAVTDGGTADVPAGVEAVTWEELVVASDESFVPAQPVRHDTVLAILYSSGTTGRPKGIMMPHAHVHAFASQWIRVVQLKSEDVLYGSTPLFYMLATILGFVPILLVRGRMRIRPRFSASRYWDDIRECGATIAHSVFTVIPILLKQAPTPLDRQHNCTRLYIGKSNAEFEERFGVRLIEIYGSTELNIVTYNPWDEFKPGSCGKVAPNFEVKIVDDDDNELPQGEIGEIVSRPLEPFSISYGYYKRPEVTVEAWRNLWFHCGDRGYFDEDGYLFYVDRKKDVIRRHGENISSYELERQVNTHDLVLESAAIPVPSELGEDEVKICVVPKEGAMIDPQQLVDHVAALVPKFMVPRYVEFVAELPRTGSLKIEKYKLQETWRNSETYDAAEGGYVGA
jgi:crotonobetaine/carnitine-CoA ligase